MTSPTRPCGPRARPGDRHVIAALLRGELSSARGPGGALTRQHTTYHAAASIPRGRRAMMPLTKRMQHESLGRFRSRSSPEAGGRRTVRVRSGNIRAEAASGVTQFDRPVRDGNQPPSRSRDAFHESTTPARRAPSPPEGEPARRPHGLLVPFQSRSVVRLDPDPEDRCIGDIAEAIGSAKSRRER